MFGLERVLHPDPAQDLGGEVGQAGVAYGSGLREGIADPQHPVVRDPDHVSGEGLLRQFPVGGEEEDRIVDAHLPAGVGRLQLHPALEASRA